MAAINIYAASIIMPTAGIWFLYLSLIISCDINKVPAVKMFIIKPYYILYYYILPFYMFYL